MDKLKPCPFCGEIPDEQPEQMPLGRCGKKPPSIGYDVSCTNRSCPYQPRTQIAWDSDEVAIEAWNIRVE